MKPKWWNKAKKQLRQRDGIMKKLLTIMVLGLFSLELNVGAREVLESKKLDAWKVDGKFIIPECLVYEWYSGDNYEEFYEKYFNKKGDHAIVHDHWPALWSGVYYLKVPNNSGELYFPQLKQSFMPNENQLVLFNGSTRHGVKENLNDEERICVSFNIKEDESV